jgi:hypothetical protein
MLVKGKIKKKQESNKKAGIGWLVGFEGFDP